MRLVKTPTEFEGRTLDSDDSDAHIYEVSGIYETLIIQDQLGSQIKGVSWAHEDKARKADYTT